MRGWAHSSAQKGKLCSIFLVRKICTSCANKRAFHENPDPIFTDLTFIKPLSAYMYHKKYVFVVYWNILKPLLQTVDLDQTAPVCLNWVNTVYFYKYVKQ